MTDQIADLLTRVRNAIMAGHYELTIPASKMKAVILEILKAEGFISDIKSIENDSQKMLEIKISNKRIPSHIKQISKPGHRMYVKSTDIPRPLRGLGLVLVSTSQGVLPGREAIKRGVGGELICEIW